MKRKQFYEILPRLEEGISLGLFRKERVDMSTLSTPLPCVSTTGLEDSGTDSGLEGSVYTVYNKRG